MEQSLHDERHRDCQTNQWPASCSGCSHFPKNTQVWKKLTIQRQNNKKSWGYRGACPALGLPELQPMDVLAQHTHRGDTFHLGSVTLTAGPWRISLVTPSMLASCGSCLAELL